MVMASYLDWPVSHIRHSNAGGGTAGVKVHFARAGDACARLVRVILGWFEDAHLGHRQKAPVKRQFQIAVFAGNGVMHGDQFCAIRECSLDLHFGDHGGHAFPHQNGDHQDETERDS